MVLDRLKGWRFPRGMPRLDWIQVEVTTHCNASCLYCPRTVYRDAWHDRHLDMDTFRGLSAAFGTAGLVYLQGWGEPLLNPRFFDMARLAKKAGCLVGVTSNATCLDRDAVRSLCDARVDVVALSLAGTTEGNDRTRRGTSLSQVMSALADFRRVKAERQGDGPSVHVAYMLLRSKRDEVRALPGLLKGTGVDQVVISTLDFVASESLRDEAVLHGDDDLSGIEALLDEVSACGREQGLAVHYGRRSSARSGLSCAEHAVSALFVAADGTVAPCVYLGLPVKEVSFVLGGIVAPYRRVSFGSVSDEPLAAIWRRAAYGAFRDALASGHPAGECGECPKRSL